LPAPFIQISKHLAFPSIAHNTYQDFLLLSVCRLQGKPSRAQPPQAASPRY
jgi:hypothetical protein